MAGEHTRGGGCGLIRLNARNLTRGDSRMKVRFMTLPDTLSGAAWPSSVRAVRCHVKSCKFVMPHSYKQQIPNINMEYQVNIETSWIAGLWAADRGSLAKGVISINNTEKALLDEFVKLSLKNFDITESRIRSRTIKGYGISNEVYFTRLPVRRFIEELFKKRNFLGTRNKMAFIAGRFDGDGSANAKNSQCCVYYSLKELDQLKVDNKIIKNLGFKTSITTCGRKAYRISVLRPRNFALQTLGFVKHPKKRAELELLVSKRHYGAQRTRPVPYVTTGPIWFRYSYGTAADKAEEGAVDGRSVWS